MSNLTGNRRYRVWKGRLVLQVQYEKESTLGIRTIYPWRDAKLEDISENRKQDAYTASLEVED